MGSGTRVGKAAAVRGLIIGVAGIAAVVFCVGCGENPGIGGGGKHVTSFVDSRDSTSYKKVKIGAQTWMAENMNYDVPDDTADVCYNNSADSCAKYGRLYDWATAKKACPAGWHLPSDTEWDTLESYVDNRSAAGKKLESTSGFNNGKKLKSASGWSNNGSGTDEYGFSALPAGNGLSSDVYGPGISNFSNAGNNGFWWNSTEYTAGLAWLRCMYYYGEYVYKEYYDKTYLFSVRCVQD